LIVFAGNAESTETGKELEGVLFPFISFNCPEKHGQLKDMKGPMEKT
jgi:hypothetical protein